MKRIIPLLLIIIIALHANAQDRLHSANNSIQKTIHTLETGFDLTPVQQDLQNIAGKLRFADAYINTTDRHLSYRLLNVHAIFLEQVKTKLDQNNTLLLSKNKSLHIIHNNIEKFKPADAAPSVLALYNNAENLYTGKALQLSGLQHTLDSNMVVLATLRKNLLQKIKNFNASVLRATDVPLLKESHAGYSKNFIDVIKDSADTGSKIMLYYLSAHLYAVSVTVLLCLLFTTWLIFIRKEYSKHIVTYVRTNKIKLKYLSANPLFGSLLLAFSFAPFFFPNPPVIFIELVWTILGLILTVLFFKDKNIPLTVRVLWAAFFIAFRIVAFVNLFLYATYEERWLLILLNAVCITLDILILRVNKKRQIFHTRTTAFIICTSALLHMASIVCNLNGLFNLAKIFTATATFAVFTAAVLHVFTATAQEALTFQLAMFKKYFANRYQTQTVKVYTILSRSIEILAVAGWCLIFIYNLNIPALLRY